MTPYDEGQVEAFIVDAVALYIAKGAHVDPMAAIWIARMQFDAVSDGYEKARADHLSGLKRALGVPEDSSTPVPPPQVPFNGNWRDWFTGLVADRPFGQATLLAIEPAMNAAGVMLTPPNAAGDRTKIGVPRPDGSRQWVRVGFGEGVWVWMGQ